MDMAVESSQTIRRIEVKFLGLTRIETGTTKDYVELPESATIRDVIRVLTEKYGSRLERTLLSTGGQCCTMAKVRVDGINIDDVGGIDSSISNVQVISFVSMVPLAGG
jgi:molybdopterin converting factor small subunit